MTHETIPIETKDAGKVHILTGIVTDTGDGVVDVNIDDYGVVSDIPVFYHCPESETANGMPFFINDRVIIVNSGSAVTPSTANMKVIGFEDGLLRECVFHFKITRGDGTIITDSAELDGYFDIYNSSEGWISSTLFTYNPATEYWTVTIDPADIDENGYWVFIDCEDGIETQYPFRYKDDDQFNAADLIPFGTYEANIPYWITKFFYVDIVLGSLVTCPNVSYDPAHMGSGYFVMAPSRSWSKRYNVKSSVPYKVTRQAKSVYTPTSGSSNINDRFFFNFSGQPNCCCAGSACYGSSGLSCGNIASAKISGGALNQNVTGQNIFYVLDYTYEVADINGKDNDITLTNNTALTVSHLCPVYPPGTGGACAVQGVQSGSLKSLSGSFNLISIWVTYDY
ncbi:MAG: hypothetical protein Q7J15_07750 [Candidatus Desulfaltia sp.]|nr:hypothetical protein [Candidatus Desulfaltia sp.]